MNKVYLADSQQLDSFLAPESIDAVLTGPPYWNEVVYSKHQGQLSNIESYSDFLSRMTSVWQGCEKVLKLGGILSFWVHDFFRDAEGNKKYVPFHADMIKSMPEGLILRNILVWDRYLTRNRGDWPQNRSLGTHLQFILVFQKAGEHKNQKLIAQSLLKNYWEPIWHKKTNPKLFGSMAIFKFLFFLGKPFRQLLDPIRQKIYHSRATQDEYVSQVYTTADPEEIIEKIMSEYSQAGDTVLDPFLGSGTVMKVAQNLGRHCIGVEINPDALGAIKAKVGEVEIIRS